MELRGAVCVQRPNWRECRRGEDGDYSDDGDYGVRRLFLTATLAEEDRTGKAKSFANDY